MSQEINRMLLELERSMRSINREVINPEIKELTIDGLRPLIRLIAQARARYLRALFELGDKNSGQTPDARQLEELGTGRPHLRLCVDSRRCCEHQQTGQAQQGKDTGFAMKRHSLCPATSLIQHLNLIYFHFVILGLFQI